LGASGAIGALLLVTVTRYWFSYLYNRPTLYVMPVLLGIYLIARVLFVCFSSMSETIRAGRKPPEGRTPSEWIFGEDADREWWARLSGWILLVMIAWLVVTGICLFGSYLPEALDHLIRGRAAKGGSDGGAAVVKWVVSALGAVSGLIAALTGSSAKTPATPNAPGNSTPTAMKIILAITGPLFIICLIILLSWGVKGLGAWFVDQPELFDVGQDWKRGTRPLELWMWLGFPGLLLILAAISCIAGMFVNVNRFSLHGMYRNRLVRAYLGASNLEDTGNRRTPDPFTGFAMSDNLALHELCGDGEPEHADAIRPFPIINTTLNLVHGANLAWQQRKAASFSMTPLYCGWSEGYRSSREYGGTGGITVGTAMTISGAAANPNMGYSSSPVLSFLMALFNVRLGAWLGNTNPSGNSSYTRHGPMQALRSLFSEMFGLTDATSRYVNLSDGAHFDNLGLYEVVKRRCRYVLASDAGMDRKFYFEDLGNAIRKIRVDFGIDIVFKEKIDILPNGPGKKPGLYCAIASIRYGEIDGTREENDGTLIYIKPSLRGRETNVLPYDIYSYSRGSDTFPHESTVDQWFSESQFESYRALGFHILEQLSKKIAAPKGTDRFKSLLDSIEQYIAEKPVDGKPTDPATEGG
jgi:hypothetical protein